MSVKVLDRQGRWRNKIVAFRVSPEEDEQLEAAVRLSGLTKQDYIIRRLQEKEIVIDINLHAGAESATAWGCDLTYDYVKINGDYRT